MFSSNLRVSWHSSGASSAPWTVNPAFYTLIDYFNHFDIDERFDPLHAATIIRMFESNGGHSSGPMEEYKGERGRK